MRRHDGILVSDAFGSPTECCHGAWESPRQKPVKECWSSENRDMIQCVFRTYKCNVDVADAIIAEGAEDIGVRIDRG